MLIRCIRPFGNFEPGAEVEVPDDAQFDHVHFEAVSQPDVATSNQENA